MPGHVRAADAPEDLWRCHECGWTYPNHHPSAKHRRNHKKQCGKLPGFMKTTDLTSSLRATTGSSDDASSDEEHHRSPKHAHETSDWENCHHKEFLQSPAQGAGASVEQVSRKGSDQTPSHDHGSGDTPTMLEKVALSSRDLDLPGSKEVAKTPNGSDQGRSSSLGSAHPLKGQWCCRHCGWAYPNAHPSAKNRRKHKKSCGIAAAHTRAGGSSDETSSDDGSESNERAETQEPIKCNSGASQGPLAAEMTNGVNARDEDLSKDVEVQALKDNAQDAPVEFDSNNSQVPSGATSMDGDNEGKAREKLDLDDSRVAMLDHEKTKLTDEQAPAVPNTNDVPVPLMDKMNSSQSQEASAISNGAVSNARKPGEPDETAIDQQSPNVTTEQVEDKEPHLPHLILTRENVRKSTDGREEGDAASTLSWSPATLGTNSRRDLIGSPQQDMKNGQPKSAPLGGVQEESASIDFEDSPEGLVRSRVYIFEKLAGTSPQYLRKSLSPSPNSASPRLPWRHGTTGTTVTGSDSPGTPKVLQESISHLRHRQSSERGTQSVSGDDTSNELHEVMSHLRHRGSFVQSANNEIPVERS